MTRQVEGTVGDSVAVRAISVNLTPPPDDHPLARDALAIPVRNGGLVVARDLDHLPPPPTTR